MWEESLEKAEEALGGSEACFEKGFFNSCVSRAYYSIFWSAITALEHNGTEQRIWSHQGLNNTFALELIKKKNIFDKRYGKIISSVYDARIIADYRIYNIVQKRAERILRDAKEFFNEVEKKVIV